LRGVAVVSPIFSDCGTLPRLRSQARTVDHFESHDRIGYQASSRFMFIVRSSHSWRVHMAFSNFMLGATVTNAAKPARNAAQGIAAA
jgi:hypothetical protein